MLGRVLPQFLKIHVIEIRYPTRSMSKIDTSKFPKGKDTDKTTAALHT